jgi:Holliday junction resolvasome RuvABC ATP-dependent DNA helicase subunit
MYDLRQKNYSFYLHAIHSNVFFTHVTTTFLEDREQTKKNLQEHIGHLSSCTILCLECGRPASAKSLFMLKIEKFLLHKVYLAEGASTTKAGLQKFIAENPHKEIIIIDEIDKMPLKDQEGLLGMMERGEFVSTKVRNTQTVRANIVIFATSNSAERLSKPLLSRFTVFEIPEYTYEEFEGIAVRLIKKLHANAVIQIASSVWKTGSRDIRDVLKIAKLYNPSDGEEDMSRLISIHQKYRKTGKEYNN